MLYRTIKFRTGFFSYSNFGISPNSVTKSHRSVTIVPPQCHRSITVTCHRSTTVVSPRRHQPSLRCRRGDTAVVQHPLGQTISCVPERVDFEAGLLLTQPGYAKVTGGRLRFWWRTRRGAIPTRNGVFSAICNGLFTCRRSSIAVEATIRL